MSVPMTDVPVPIPTLIIPEFAKAIAVEALHSPEPDVVAIAQKEIANQLTTGPEKQRLFVGWVWMHGRQAFQDWKASQAAVAAREASKQEW